MFIRIFGTSEPESQYPADLENARMAHCWSLVNASADTGRNIQLRWQQSADRHPRIYQVLAARMSATLTSRLRARLRTYQTLSGSPLRDTKFSGFSIFASDIRASFPCFWKATERHTSLPKAFSVGLFRVLTPLMLCSVAVRKDLAVLFRNMYCTVLYCTV